MTAPNEALLSLAADERREAEECARESGWPDDFYFELLAASLRALSHGERG